MNFKNLFVMGLVASTVTLYSCGGEEKPESDTTEESTTEETTEEEGMPSGSYTLNAADEGSVVNWKGSMVNMYDHLGQVKFKEGSLELKEGEVTGGSFTIDMNTIEATDTESFGYSEEKSAAMLVGHLKSDDFFDVESFGEAKFEVTSAGSGIVKGNLTIRDKTNEVEVTDVVVSTSGDNLTATGKLVFDRSKFDVKYGSESFFDNLGDKVIDNNISLEVSIKATK